MNHPEIQKRVDAFVTELSELVRQSALDAVRTALGNGASSNSAPARSRGRAVKVPTQSLTKGVRRTPQEMTATRAKILAYVTANPGQRIEQIAAGLKVPAASLHLPTRTMVGKTLRTTGERRATRYFPLNRAKAAGKAQRKVRKARGSK